MKYLTNLHDLFRSTMSVYKELSCWAKVPKLSALRASIKYFVTGDCGYTNGQFRARHFLLWSKQVP